jgi:hypothetical protein
MIVPKHHVGPEDPTFKMIQMGKFVFDVGVDPVGQREVSRGDMNVHKRILGRVLPTVDPASAKKFHENRWLGTPPSA